MIVKRPAVVVDRNPQSETFLSIATFVPIARWRDVLSSFKLSNQVEVQLRRSSGHSRLLPRGESLAAALLDILGLERQDSNASVYED